MVDYPNNDISFQDSIHYHMNIHMFSEVCCLQYNYNKISFLILELEFISGWVKDESLHDNKGK